MISEETGFPVDASQDTVIDAIKSIKFDLNILPSVCRIKKKYFISKSLLRKE